MYGHSHHPITSIGARQVVLRRGGISIWNQTVREIICCTDAKNLHSKHYTVFDRRQQNEAGSIQTGKRWDAWRHFRFCKTAEVVDKSFAVQKMQSQTKGDGKTTSFLPRRHGDMELLTPKAEVTPACLLYWEVVLQIFRTEEVDSEIAVFIIF